MQFTSPLSKRLSFAAKGEQWHAALIVALLLRCSPFAIIRFVIAFIVDALKGVCAGRLAPHVGVEILKRFKPTVANCNPATSVPKVGFIFQVITSLLHTNPASVFTAFCQPMSLLRPAEFKGGLPTDTAAALGSAAPLAAQFGADRDHLVSAVAQAVPCRVIASVTTCIVDYKESAKTLAGNIHEVVRKVTHIRVSIMQKRVEGKVCI